MSFLERIRPDKEAEVKALKELFATTEPRRPERLEVRNFTGALRGDQALIAEVKRKSPSHPEFHQPASAATLARCYQRNGAAALSIVTDEKHFGTSLNDIEAVKNACDLPVLVKDFVIDESQILAAWAAGADAILLIVRMLEGPRLGELLEYAHSLRLHVLVECHDQNDIDQAQAVDARIIGVNNRNLATLTTDLAHGAAMLPGIRSHAIRVSESGLYKRDDILHMAGLGANAFLVGHALLQSSDPGRKVAELSGQEDEQQTRVKVCGLTDLDDAVLTAKAGADILGLIFASSARTVSHETAAGIRQTLPRTRLCGVFVDEEIHRVVALAEEFKLDLVQLHGQESPEICRQLSQSVGLPLIKALVPHAGIVETARSYAAVSYFLVDLPKSTGSSGLTTADCLAAAEELTAAGFEVFLAGKLTPESVASLDSSRRPFALDVASGVECRPGRKDALKIKTFIAEAKR